MCASNRGVQSPMVGPGIGGATLALLLIGDSAACTSNPPNEAASSTQTSGADSETPDTEDSDGSSAANEDEAADEGLDTMETSSESQEDSGAGSDTGDDCSNLSKPDLDALVPAVDCADISGDDLVCMSVAGIESSETFHVLSCGGMDSGSFDCSNDDGRWEFGFGKGWTMTAKFDDLDRFIEFRAVHERMLSDFMFDEGDLDELEIEFRGLETKVPQLDQDSASFLGADITGLYNYYDDQNPWAAASGSLRAAWWDPENCISVGLSITFNFAYEFMTREPAGSAPAGPRTRS